MNDELKHLIGAYLGMLTLDEYELKPYIVKDIEKYIINYIEENNIDINYKDELDSIDKELSLRVKLQDVLDIISKVDAPIELVLLINKKLKDID